MPNHTTIHDAAQAVLREIERKQNMKPLEIGPFTFDPRDRVPTWQAIDIIGEYENTYMDEDEATKLVAMILQVFPKIREQFKEGKL